MFKKGFVFKNYLFCDFSNGIRVILDKVMYWRTFLILLIMLADDQALMLHKSSTLKDPLKG